MTHSKSAPKFFGHNQSSYIKKTIRRWIDDSTIVDKFTNFQKKNLVEIMNIIF